MHALMQVMAAESGSVGGVTIIRTATTATNSSAGHTPKPRQQPGGAPPPPPASATPSKGSQAPAAAAAALATPRGLARRNGEGDSMSVAGGEVQVRGAVGGTQRHALSVHRCGPLRRAPDGCFRRHLQRCSVAQRWGTGARAVRVERHVHSAEVVLRATCGAQVLLAPAMQLATEVGAPGGGAGQAGEAPTAAALRTGTQIRK